VKKVLVSLAVSLLLGCASLMPNSISESKSNFDGSVSYKMEPGFIYADASFWSYGHFKLGLFWNNKSKDSISINVVVPSEIINIKSDEGLQFNIDGEIVKLTSSQGITDFETTETSTAVYTSSNKTFRTNVEFVRKLLSAKSVKVKLVMRDGYYEGDFKNAKPTSAVRGFKDFMVKLQPHI